MAKNDVTKNDFEEIVSKVVGESTREILNVIGGELAETQGEVVNIKKQLNNTKKQLDETQNTVDRIESMLEPTIRKVDDHETRIKKLEHRAA